MGQVKHQTLCPLLVLTMTAACVMMVSSLPDTEVDGKEIKIVGAAIRRAADAVRKARSELHEAQRVIEESALPEEVSAAFKVVLREKIAEELGTGSTGSSSPSFWNKDETTKTDGKYIFKEQLLKLVSEHSEGLDSPDHLSPISLLLTVWDVVKTVLFMPFHMVAFLVWRVWQFLSWCTGNVLSAPTFVYKMLQGVNWLGGIIIHVLTQTVMLVVSLISMTIAFILYTVYITFAFVFSTLWMLLYGVYSMIMIPVHIFILSSPLLIMYLISQPDVNHVMRWLQEKARRVQLFVRDMFLDYRHQRRPLPNPSVQASPLGFTTYPSASPAPRTQERTDSDGWEPHEHLLHPRGSSRLRGLRRHLFLEDIEDDNSCVVCLDRPANMTLRPCGHRCVCRGCALRILNPRLGEDGGKCPLDRQQILVAVPDCICVIS